MTAPVHSLSVTAVLWDVQPMLALYSRPGTVRHHSSVQPVTEFTRLLSLTKPEPHFQLPFVPSRCFHKSSWHPQCFVFSFASWSPAHLCSQLFYSCFTHEDSCHLVKKATLLLPFFGFIKLITTFLWMSDAMSSLWVKTTYRARIKITPSEIFLGT